MPKLAMQGYGFVDMTPDGPLWTGRVELVNSQQRWPLTWRGGRDALAEGGYLSAAPHVDDLSVIELREQRQ